MDGLTAELSELDRFLAGVTGLVEASIFERQMLWEENQRRQPPREWVENLSGRIEIVGHLDDDPVCISMFTARIDGELILFYHDTSAVVDHKMIERWLFEKAPTTALRGTGYLNRVDAMNFHNVFRR
jgi:hypothetical protein